MARRRCRNPAVASGIRFADGFAPPSQELESQPSEKWLSGARRQVALVVGTEVLGEIRPGELGREAGVSEKTARTILGELKKLGAVREERAMRRGVRREKVWTVNPAASDLVAWIAYRDELAGSEAGDASFAFGEAEPSLPAMPAGFDQWDWGETRKHRDLPPVQVEHRPGRDASDALQVIAWSPDGDRVGVCDWWPSAAEGGEERDFGGLPPSGFASISRLWVHPAWRRGGIGSLLVSEAARKADERYQLPLASAAERSHEESRWWGHQARRGRAKVLKHTSDRHPSATRYLVGRPVPDPVTMRNPRQSGICGLCGRDCPGNLCERCAPGVYGPDLCDYCNQPVHEPGLCPACRARFGVK